MIRSIILNNLRIIISSSLIKSILRSEDTALKVVQESVFTCHFLKTTQDTSEFTKNLLFLRTLFNHYEDTYFS